MTIDNLFFELLRVSIGKSGCLSKTPTNEEWKALYDIAIKQSLVGVCFVGLHSLCINPDNGFMRIGMSEDLFFNWMGMATQINIRNEVVSKAVGKVKEHLEHEGFDMVLLKGQGNMCNYPDSLRMFRNSGDIDTWIMPKNFEAMSLNECMKNDEIVLKHFWKKDSTIRHCYIHINDSQIKGIDVEVHYRPSFINAPWRNRKFQRWMVEKAPEQFSNIAILPESGDVRVAVPTNSFNLIYQLNHMYRHIFDDGLGLRQIMDYYFLLQQDLTYVDTKSLQKEIEMFGMKHFASALMFVMQKVFCLPINKMIAPPDEKSGRFLLSEIMQSGNFGHYDERQKRTKHENGVERFLRRQKRNMRFLGQYAEEVLCVPLFRVYQEYWRIKMNIKCK